MAERGSQAAGSQARPSVVIVGGGIAGLAAAWELTGRAGTGGSEGTEGTEGTDVTVLEAGSRFGGKILTTEIGGRPVDVGPDAFVSRRPEARALCEQLGLSGDLVEPGTRGASVWARGRLRPLPDGLAIGVPTRLGPLARSGIVGPMSVARAALDLLGPAPTRSSTGPPPPDEALGPLVHGHLGAAVVRRLVDPLMGGIHAGPVDAMSTEAVLPSALGRSGRRTGLMRSLRPAAAPAGRRTPETPTPVFLSVRGGMGRMVDRLTGELAGRGACLTTGVDVHGLTLGPGGWTVHADDGDRHADAVVVAVPAAAAAGLLVETAPAAAGLLGAVPSASVTLVTMTFPDSAFARPAGTGFLVPAEQGLLLTGCTWLSAKWPELGRPGAILVRASCGRFGDERAVAMTDDEVVARVVDELRALVGAAATPTDVVVTRWPDGFPQYEVGHLDRMAEAERLVGEAGAPLALAGAYLAGVGIPACIGSGRRAALAVGRRLTSSRAGLAPR